MTPIYPQADVYTTPLQTIPKNWGYEQVWHHNTDFTVKTLVFNPGARGSYHYHRVKSEHWIVRFGTGEVWIGDASADTQPDKRQRHELFPGVCIYLPQGVRHQVIANEMGLTIEEASTPHADEDTYRVLMYDQHAGRDAAQVHLVLTTGAFDGLHAGHVDMLAYARTCGTHLCIALNTDESVAQYKGKTRYTYADRYLVLSALGLADEILPLHEPTAAALIRKIKPQVFVKGSEYAHTLLQAERDAVELHGGVVSFFPVREDSLGKLSSSR